MAHRALDVAGPLLLLSLFYFMNYQKIYDQIIERAKTRELEGYVEKHHVIPRCIGGGNERSNIVELTAREHFLCHWLLHEIYPTNNKLAFCFWGMCNQKNQYQKERYTPNNRLYEYAKKINSHFSSITQKGKKKNIESIKKMVETRKKNGSYEQTDEHKIKNGLANKGKKRSLEYCNSVSKRLKGIPKTKSHIENMKKPKQKVACPYCGKLGALNNKWHFNNCKLKK